MSNSHVTIGLARHVSRSLPRCELLHLSRQEFDLELARRQHSMYVAALQSAGVQVTVLPELLDLPDSVFVEDTAIILDEVAIVCRLGIASREPEADAIAPAISKLRQTRRIVFPGTLEGGDVLRVGKTLFVGVSSRTNREGIRQLEEFVRHFDYQVTHVEIRECLHLQSAATSPSDGLLIANPAWIDPSAFRGLEILAVPSDEPWGANILAVNGKVLVPDSAPKTARLLRNKGLAVETLAVNAKGRGRPDVPQSSFLTIPVRGLLKQAGTKRLQLRRAARGVQNPV